MAVSRKITTHKKGKQSGTELGTEPGTERNYSWVQYINLDWEVLNPSPCE